jgi:hypothetical protein
MPWYTTQRVDNFAILRLKGEASARVYQWLGGLNGLTVRGHKQIVVGLEAVTLSKPGDASFLATIAERIQDIEGDVVFVAPTDLHAHKVLRQSRLSRSLTFATSVDAGITELSMLRDRNVRHRKQ